MRVLAVFSFSFSAAVFAAVYGQRDGWLPFLSAGLGLLALILAVLLRKRTRLRRGSLLAILGAAAGLLWCWTYGQMFFRPAEALDGQTARLEAVVSDFPKEREFGGFTVPVRVDTGGLTPITAVFFVDGQGRELQPGDRLRAVVHCTLGSRTFSGEKITYYTAKGIFLQGQVYGRLVVERPEHVPVRCWPAMLAKALKDGIGRTFSPAEAGLIQGIVTGSRENLTDQFTSSLERAGLSHTVAVSGMHLAFLAGLLSQLLGRGRRATALLTILWALGFSALAGNTPSVNRAAVMIILLQLAPLFDRERDGATSLGFALMVLLIWNPYSAAHVGLQLSFASVAGIMTVSDAVHERLLRLFRLNRPPQNAMVHLLRAIPHFAAASLSATLGAMVFTTPLVALHFGSFSLISPLANLMTLWAVGLLFVGGLLSGILAVVSPALASVTAIPTGWLARYVDWSAELLSRPALASLSMEAELYRMWLVFAYLLLILGVMMRGKKRLCIPLCAGVFTLTLAILATGLQFRTGTMGVTVLDVGQGQSVLVREGSLWTLVDCGGSGLEDPGDIAADYIQSRGRNFLDVLIVSHYHDDHANGVPQLLRRLKVNMLVLPDVEPDAPLRREILEVAGAQGAQVVFISEDLKISMGNGQSLCVYGPMESSGETNELGLTVLAQSGEFTALLTGDMGGNGEKKLIRKAVLPQVDLLVVGHHGSPSSTTEELLAAIRPKLAVVSVGEGNKYGHPDRGVLERLRVAGTEVYRTDLDGRIEIKG